MLKVYSFEKGLVKPSSSEDLISASVCWTDCTKPTQEELKDISEKANIPLTDLQEVLDEEERPKVSDLEEYSLIIVRTPSEENGDISTTPIAMFVSKKKNNVITVSLNETKAIAKMEGLVKANKIELYEKGTGFFIYRLIDIILNEYFAILDKIEESIDETENNVVTKAERFTVRNIFSVKKTLIFFQRALIANREVITAIEKEYLTNIDKKNIKRFRTLYNDVTQLIEAVGTYRDILTGILDVYLSSVSNNLNKVIKTLTIISSFVLIPTLIASIYGMNFANNGPFNMPELYWKYGYFFALGLMAISIIATYVYFKRKKWM
ncbi:magnesium/cobalt transporter CorA [Candidatus Woesearchaeota archaeon]|nr:magnesium/cobalt transporter CorA [Candidatus Woesearchaeota archaeon]